MITNKLVASIAVATLLIFALKADETARTNSGIAMDQSVGHGDPETLKVAFNTWRENYEKHGGSPETLKLNAGYSKALSQRHTDAKGRLEFNLADGNLRFHAQGFADGDYDLWLIDNGDNPGNTVRPDASDRFLKVGDFKSQSAKANLEARLTTAQLAGFTIDAVVVTSAGKTPVEEVLITGAPDLMTKLYYASQVWPLTSSDDPSLKRKAAPNAFDFVLPKVALADTVSDLTPVLGTLVAEGRQLFHNATFSGNGRTCGTCHRAENNFTLDPNFIAKLPASDPLFVAETKPSLLGLEDPVLVRKFALINTDVDANGSSIFRSVPHTLALATSIISESTAPQPPFVAGEFAEDNAFQGATGWSGDGAPGSGTLREFTTGAVFQHFPKTLARNSDPNDAIPDDFQLPNDDQLNKIEAYMLSLGRSKDYPIWKLTFADEITQAGKLLFDTKENPCANGTAQTGGPTPPPTCSGEAVNPNNVTLGSTANCNGCHQHAGARSSTTFANPTRNTGVEGFKLNMARLAQPGMPYDGGFGVVSSSCGPNFDQSCFGDGRFNTPPLIEAADTAPFFHNNSVATLEEAVAAYNSDAFNFSPSAVTSKRHDRRVKLDATQVTAVASFLRAVNALENIRVSNRLDNQAKQVSNLASARELSRLAIEENQDAIQVLKDGKVLGGYAEAIKRLESANYYQSLAQTATSLNLRNALLQQAINSKQSAKGLLATCNENAARPSTVGSSPAGFVYTCAELDAL